MVLVSLQGQVSVFLTHEPNKSFSVPPALSVEAECNPSSVQHNRQSACREQRREIVACTMLQEKYLAMLSPLKKRAMSWSEDCHGSPLALITVPSHTFSILLLHKCTQRHVLAQRREDFEFQRQGSDQTLLTKCLFQISH